jgi:hypothetical protein
MKANGWKMLTPEIIAAEKAALMVENAFYSDAAAAQVLHNALQKLVLDYQSLQAASMKNAVPVNGGVSTVAGNPVMVGGRRVVDPNDPYVGDPNTRAMSHIRPRDPNNPATIFGGVPGAIPVNRGISRTPQMYMHDRLPNIEGLTSVKGISTGIVPGEAAKFHALMATLGMQTEQEVAALKKTIAMGGTVSAELLDTFDDILPITKRFADSAATQAASIVQQMRNAEITVEQAKARILALNAQIEADMGSAVTAYAAGRGRRIDLTRAPMMDQPVVDANGQFTLRDLYKKKTNASVMEEFGRLRGVRTFGAPYSIQTTRLPKFNIGGDIESFGPNKTMVSGPSSINYDDRLGSVPLGGYVLNQQAAMDPANAPLVAMAPSTYLNDGGNITAALTPREVVFGPQIQRMPELYAAVDAANSGYNFGGQIMSGTYGYGRESTLSIWARLVNSKDYPKVIKAATVASDAAILSQLTGMDIKDATKRVSADYDSAIEHAKKAAAKNGTRKTEEFVKARTAQLIRLSKEFPGANLILDEYSNKNKYDQSAKAARMKAIAPQTYAGTMRSVIDDLVKEGVLTQSQANKVFGILGQTSDTYDPISKSHTMTAKRSASIFKPGELQALLVEEGMSRAEAEKYAGVTGVRSNNFVGQSTGLSKSFNTMGRWLDVATDGAFRDEVSPFQDEAKSNFISGIKRLKAKLGITGPTTMREIIRQLTLMRIKSGVGYNSKMVTTLGGRLAGRGISFAKPALGPLAGAFNKGGMIPGGSISRNRKNYGFVSPALRLLAPAQQLKILQQAREMSATTPAGYIPASYSHLLTPSTGRSFPVPGVAGVYQNEEKKKVFFKAVPNEVSLTAEMRGTEIGRILGLVTPVQVARSIRNPLDPTGKSRFLGAESDYDEGFINPNTSVPGKFTQDEVLDQFIASMILANKDLSRSNVHGRRLADVGNGGVLAKASMNDDYAKTLPSMEEMALANLLQVKGGSRKDFARDTAPIIAKMTAKEYGDKIKEKMEAAYPELKRYIKSLPKKDRKPYDALLKRFEEGMDVDWSKYHAMHVNPKYLNAGGPVGGGPVQRSRYAYGRKKDGSRVSGNPAKRAQQERLKAERSVTPVSRSGYTSSGNPQMQVQQIPYVGGAGVFGNAFGASQTGQSQQAINTLRLSQIGQLAPGITRSFKSLTDSIKLGTVGLRYGIMNSGKYLSSAYADYAKERISSARITTRTIREGILREQSKRLSAAYPGQMMPMYISGPGAGVGNVGAVGAWKDYGEDGVKSRKVGTYGYRRREFMDASGKIYDTKAAKAAGIDTRVRGGMGMGAQMGIGMAGSMGAMSLMQQEKVLGMSGMTAGLALMGASTIIPMLPWKTIGSSVKSTTTSVVASIKAFKSVKDAISAVGASASNFVTKFKALGAVLSIVLVGLDTWKKYNNAQQDAAMGLSITADGAEQAGIKYFNLNQYLTDYIEKQKLANAAAQGSKNNSIGMPGIPQSVDEMKKAKEEGKVLKDLIESINRTSSTGELQRLINNQKAQYIAGGLSVEQSNSMIYGAIANSKKASQAYKLLADQGFGAIEDRSSAAEFAVGNLVKTINGNKSSFSLWKDNVDFQPSDLLNPITFSTNLFDSYGQTFADANAQKKAVVSGFESMIGIVNAGTQALIGTKNAQGDLIDEFEAYQTMLASTEKNIPEFNIPIGKDTYQTLKEMSPELEKIINEFDTLKSILAKTKLFTSGISIDLKSIDADLAIKLAGFTAAIGSGIADLTAAGNSENTYGATGKVLKRLQESILATSAASQKAAAVSQRNIQEEIKLIAKKISLIEDEKNKKLESLRATQDASNYALELQKLQIEYADAVARGDVSGAARARINIDQLTANRQADLAEKAIQDEAARLKAIEQKKIDAKQAAADKKAIAFQNRQDNATNAAAVMDVVKGFKATYDEITALRITNSMMPESEAKRKAEGELVGKLSDLLKKVGVAGTGSSETAKAIRESFAQYFNKDGTIKKVYVESPGLPAATNSGVTSTTITTLNKDILKILDRDVALVSSMATQITGGKGYSIKTMTEEIVAALKGTSKTVYGGKSKDVFGMDMLINTLLPSQQGKINKFAKEKGYKAGQQFTLKESNGILKEFIVLNDGTVKFVKNTSPTYASGGKVTGPGTGTSDSIPAMLSDGEYVIKASSVAKYGVETLDALNAQKLHKGGPVGHRHGRNLPGSLFRWKSYPEDMPDYWSDGSPSGSPYTQRWGALRYGPAKGKDIWGGTEIPGLRFDGKIANRSDYWHQIAEQPVKYSGPGMALDKDPMRYAGSGASMSGIGNGVYGAGSWLTFANGGPVGNKNKNGNWFSRFNPVNSISSMLSGMFSFGASKAVNQNVNVQSTMTQQEKDRALLQTVQMLSGYTSAFNLKNSTSPEIAGSQKLGTAADVLGVLPLIGGLSKITKLPGVAAKSKLVTPDISLTPAGPLSSFNAAKYEGKNISAKNMQKFLSDVLGDVSLPAIKAEKLPWNIAGQYVPRFADKSSNYENLLPHILLNSNHKTSGQTAVHETMHHFDFETHNTFKRTLEMLRKSGKYDLADRYESVYVNAEKQQKGLGFATWEDYAIGQKDIDSIAWSNGAAEAFADENTFKAYLNFVNSKSLKDKMLASKIGNTYGPGLGTDNLRGYFKTFRMFEQNALALPLRLNPQFLKGFIDNSPNMPEKTKTIYQMWQEGLQEFNPAAYVSKPEELPNSVQYKKFKDYITSLNLDKAKGYHKGGPVGHKHENFFSRFNPANVFASITNGMFGFGASKAFNKNISAPKIDQSETDLAALQTAQMLTGYTSAFNLKNKTSPEIFGSQNLGVAADVLGVLPGLGLASKLTRPITKPITSKIAVDAFTPIKVNAKIKETLLGPSALSPYESAMIKAEKLAKAGKFTPIEKLGTVKYEDLLKEARNLTEHTGTFPTPKGDYSFKFKPAQIDQYPPESTFKSGISGIQENMYGNEWVGPMHNIEVYAPDGSVAGNITWDSITGTIRLIGVNHNHRKLGIARFMNEYGASITRIKHSKQRTADGVGYSEAIGGIMPNMPFISPGKVTLASLVSNAANSRLAALRSKLIPGKPYTPKPYSEPQPSEAQLAYDAQYAARMEKQRLAVEAAGKAQYEALIAWRKNPNRTYNSYPFGHGSYVEMIDDLDLRLLMKQGNDTPATWPWKNPYLPPIASRAPHSRPGSNIWSENGYGHTSDAAGGYINNTGLNLTNSMSTAFSRLGVPQFENGINMVPANMLAMLHKDEAVIPANMNPFNPNASAAVSGSVYNINVELNGTNVTAQDVATQIHREMRLKEMAAGVNRRVGG